MRRARSERASSGEGASLKKSIDLNPCFSQSYHGLGFALTLSGQLEAAKQSTEKAINMSPRDPMLWAFHAVHSITLILNEEFEEALESADTTIRFPAATGYWGHAVKASALANLDRIEESEKALALAVEAKPDLSVSFLEGNMPTKFEGGLDPYINGLRKAGLRDA